MTVMEQLKETQERVLADVEQAQNRVVEVNQRLADAAGNWVPKVELPTPVSIPSLDDMPRGPQLAATYFDFAGKVLELNRAFVEQIIGVWSPTDAEKPASKGKSKAKAD